MLYGPPGTVSAGSIISIISIISIVSMLPDYRTVHQWNYLVFRKLNCLPGVYILILCQRFCVSAALPCDELQCLFPSPHPLTDTSCFKDSVLFLQLYGPCLYIECLCVSTCMCVSTKHRANLFWRRQWRRRLIPHSSPCLLRTSCRNGSGRANGS